MKQFRSIIVGSGSHIPPVVVPNEAFLNHTFLGPDREPIAKSNEEILRKFEEITGIRERRYAAEDMVTSDLALDAGRKALQSSGIDPESLDYIIVGHNFGDVRVHGARSDLVPSLAARVKSGLAIENPATVAMDLVFGCPGWLQGVIQTDYMIRCGEVRRAMIIGAETLSRVSDPHDRDSLIYSDGAGAVILESRETSDEVGILSHTVRSDTLDHASMLFMGGSYDEDAFLESLFLKMEGRKLYRYALSTVAGGMKESLDKAGVDLREVSMIFLHQANGKMDHAILAALYQLYDMDLPSETIMPMTISWLGNSSVATIPTLFDLVSRGKIEGHRLEPGNNIVFASVGAGMNINAAVYRVPEV